MKKVIAYESELEFFEDLKDIQPCDLRDNNTRETDAVKFCKEIMECFVRSSKFTPNQDKLALLLYRLGACEYDKAAKKFLGLEPSSIGVSLNEKNNIEFPLSVFTQILNTSESSYKYGWAKAMDGWIEDWLKTQEDESEKDI